MAPARIGHQLNVAKRAALGSSPPRSRRARDRSALSKVRVLKARTAAGLRAFTQMAAYRTLEAEPGR